MALRSSRRARLTGYGPGVSAALLGTARERLLGADPLDARQITTLAAAYEKSCVAHVGFGPGTFCAGHLNASLQNAVFLGPTYGTGPTWEVFHEPPVVDVDQMWSVYENAPRFDKDGYMQLPDAPGLGVSIRKDLLEDV